MYDNIEKEQSKKINNKNSLNNYSVNILNEVTIIYNNYIEYNRYNRELMMIDIKYFMMDLQIIIKIIYIY